MRSVKGGEIELQHKRRWREEWVSQSGDRTLVNDWSPVRGVHDSLFLVTQYKYFFISFSQNPSGTHMLSCTATSASVASMLHS